MHVLKTIALAAFLLTMVSAVCVAQQRDPRLLGC